MKIKTKGENGKMFLQKLKKSLPKYVFTGFVALAMLVGGFSLTICDIFQQDENEVAIVIPSVRSVGSACESLGRLGSAFYLDSEQADALAGIIDYVADNVSNASGNISTLLLLTLDQSIEKGAIPESFKIFGVGLITIMNEYFELKEFNVKDCIFCLCSFTRGLKKGEVSAQSVILTW